MLRIFQKLIVLLALSVTPVLSHATEPDASQKSSCDVYSNEHGYPLPKPFSSTICPRDKSILSVLYHFPATMETAIKLTDLDYKDEILSLIDIRGGEDHEDGADRSLASTSDEYRNDIVNLEVSVISIQSLAMWLVKILIGVQLTVISFTALRSGEIGGGKYGLFKTCSRIGVGVLLITPLPVESDILGYQTDVLVIQVIMGVAVLGAIGAANIAVSTVGYMMLSDLPDEREKTFLDTQGAPSMASIPVTKSRVLIEDALCAAQVSLLSVYEGAKDRAAGATATLSQGGSGYQYSTLGDGFPSLIEVEGDETGFSTKVGFHLEDNSGQAIPYICSEKRVNKPAFVSDVSIPDFEAYSKMEEEIVEMIDTAVQSITFEKMSDKDKLVSLWAEVKVGIDDKIKVLRLDSQKEKFLISSANYFFDQIAYLAEGGRLVEQDSETYEILNARAALAAKFARQVVSDRCYTDREAYIRTQATVKALNGGNVGVSDFSLQCAVVNGNKLEIPFEADTSSLQSFLSGSLEAAALGKTQLQDDYIGIYDSFEQYNANVEAARVAVVKGIVQALLYSQEMEGAKKNLNEITLLTREEGFAAFSHNFLALMRELTNLARNVIDTKINMEFQTMESGTTFYSSGSNFLPPSNPELSRYLSEYKVKAPEFLYVTPDTGGGILDDQLKIAAAADAQLFTEQGGSHRSGDGARSETDLDYTGGAVESKLKMTQTETLEQKAKVSVSDAIEATFRTIARAGGDRGSEIAKIQLSAQDYHKIISLCGSIKAVEIVEEKYGTAGKAVLEASCPIYIGHQQFYSQEKGQTILSYGLIVLAAYMTVKTIGSLKQAADNILQTDISNAVTEPAGNNSSNTGNGGNRGKNAAAEQSSRANQKSNNSNKLLKKLDMVGAGKVVASAANIVMGWAAAVMIILGLIMAIITPMIPVASHLLSYIGWLMLVAQLMVISSLIAMTFFMFLDQNDPNTAPEKSLYGTFVNITIRPFAMIVGFLVAFVLTYVAFIMMDMTSINMVLGMGSGSDFFFNPFKVIMNLIMVIIIWVSYIYIIKMIFEVSLKAPNNIIKKIGAESLDAREQKVGALLFAAAAASQETVRERVFEEDRAVKKAAKEVIRQNNAIYLHQQAQYVRTAFREVSDLTSSAKEKAAELLGTPNEKHGMAQSGQSQSERAPEVRSRTQVETEQNQEEIGQTTDPDAHEDTQSKDDDLNREP
ncbi:hypothetical protein [Photobacterium galatheae]|uniref:TraG N-terminal Proteobacteria domain-containing protein n=1 Tax=Photobacterium galatheae TaxID=1654360 RepID=A0A066RPB3_9GAMM|nr:hypothetical protein [Photobacterium galatheae]KDM90971.1 hypothetical protein EA58_14545 [Photobacterium galatheae]MCM0149071.1 hypothetical protein [Photobacterium galatheae]